MTSAKVTSPNLTSPNLTPAFESWRDVTTAICMAFLIGHKAPLAPFTVVFCVFLSFLLSSNNLLRCQRQGKGRGRDRSSRKGSRRIR